MTVCCICQRELPNKWAVGKREIVDGVERCYCQLHASELKNDSKANDSKVKEEEMGKENKSASLLDKLCGIVKALWAKIHPDRSPEAQIAECNEQLNINRRRIEEVNSQLEELNREIVAKKLVYEKASPARQSVLKGELQRMMTDYKCMKQELNIINENIQTITKVKGGLLKKQAYDMRGNVDTETIDIITEDINEAAGEAEDIQDSLNELDNAGQRTDRDDDNFDASLNEFGGDEEFGSTDDDVNHEENHNKENNHEDEKNDGTDAGRNSSTELGGGDIA